jgi:hypothetical protein
MTMLWQGKPLEEYSKKELMVIIETLAQNLRYIQERQQKETEKLLGY